MEAIAASSEDKIALKCIEFLDKCLDIINFKQTLWSSKDINEFRVRLRIFKAAPDLVLLRTLLTHFWDASGSICWMSEDDWEAWGAAIQTIDTFAEAHELMKCLATDLKWP